MNAADLRAMSDAQLNDELLSLRREAFNLRMQAGTGQLPRPSQISSVRKNIARVKTVQSERKNAGAAS